jgi:glycosyltransferase involved in cell wall biosynthesis
LLPSIQEGCGIVFLETIAAGKPITARSATVPEVVQHGCLVEPDNSEALAAAIEKLYFDTEFTKASKYGRFAGRTAI